MNEKLGEELDRLMCGDSAEPPDGKLEDVPTVKDNLGKGANGMKIPEQYP